MKAASLTEFKKPYTIVDRDVPEPGTLRCAAYRGFKLSMFRRSE
jgi:hypothetical protein